MKASEYGRVQVCELLLNRGADVSHEDEVSYIYVILYIIYYILYIIYYIYHNNYYIL
jgi:hypothetical protein